VRLDRFLESPSGFHHHTPGFIKWFHIPTNHMNWVEVGQVSEQARARSMQLIPSNSSHSLEYTMEEPVAWMRSCGRECSAPNHRETVYHLSMRHTCNPLFSRPEILRAYLATP
jgi:hypothetical protein